MKIFPLATLRSHVVALVIAAIVPLILFAGAMILASDRDQQAATERGMADTARALSAALDREFTGTIQALRILASSKTLANDRLPEFYEEMKAARAAFGPTWLNLALTDRTGQQLLNLRRPFGSPLPRNDPELIKQPLHNGEATISNLFIGPISGVPVIVLAVPVPRDGQIKYLLLAGFPGERLSELLSQQKLPAGWLATIIDRNQVIVARTRNLEKYQGKPAGPGLADRARQHREASWRGTTLDGIEVVSSLRRSELSGWTVSLAIPAGDFDAPLRNSLMLAGAVGLALLGASLIFATVIGRRVTRAAEQLAESARAFGRGESPRSESFPIAELNVVEREIEAAAANRDQLEKTRQESSEQVRGAFEQAGVGIVVYELESRRLKRVNQKFCDILGYTQEECLQLHLTDLSVPEEVESTAAYHARLLRGEVVSYTREKRYAHKSGQTIWTRISVSLLHNADGRPSDGLMIVEDISERKRQEHQLHALTRRLVALQESERRGLARELHDRVGQNLTILGINLMRLRGDQATSAQTQAQIDDSLAVLEATGRVISDVLTELKPPMLSSDGLLEALRWHAKQLTQRAGIAIEITDSVVPRLASDIEMALFRIAQAALNNVVQHARARSVVVRLETGDGVVRLEVVDDGSGFDVAARPISARWGLAVMKERAEAIDGSLRVESAPGRGTRIIVEAPAGS